MILFDRKKALSQILGPADHKAEGGEVDSLKECVSEFLDAVHSHDVEAATEAIKAIFADLEAEPHEEGPHTEEY